MQSVPIAVTALTDAQLSRQRVDDGRLLVLQVPNTTFSRSIFGSNFQIRGIGNALVATSGDNGVGVHENYVFQQRDHIADAEFYDLERVEVLRGPQGTLFGRNVTGGVINVITAKPTYHFEALGSAEVGNYDTLRFKGMINMPLGDKAALRVAGISVQRDGFTRDTLTNQDIDSRDLHAIRATLAFNPTERLSGFFMFEHYGEDDSRIAEAKKLCIKDPGPTSVGGVATAGNQNYFSQGCKEGSLYQDAAYGTQNTAASILSSLAKTLGLSNGGDLLAGKMQSTDLRQVEKVGTPSYRVNNNQYQLNLQYKLTDSLTATSLTAYSEDDTYSRGDSESAQATVPYSANVFFPGGVVNDPQLGSANRTESAVLSRSRSHEFSQEVRLQSNFNGPINFTVGGVYIDFNVKSDYYVFINQITAAAQLQDALGANIYVDPNINPGRHRTQLPVRLHALPPEDGRGLW